METNQVIETMLKHRSVRKFKQEKPSDEAIRTIVRAAQQAPFASQSYSFLLKRKGKLPYGAPLMFTVCVDIYKVELFMERRGWKRVANDLGMLFFALQDASLAAQNLVLAGESIGLGSCFLGNTLYRAERVKKEYNLPDKVFPFVQLVMGYSDEDYPPRPRFPQDFTLFEDEYKITDKMLTEAMQAMDEGYLAQGYYQKKKIKIKLENGRKDSFTFDDYSWTEHISRKWGQWMEDPQELLNQLKKCGLEW
ncbi:nitroreductase family protein [Chloroflexota bacterium]